MLLFKIYRCGDNFPCVEVEDVAPGQLTDDHTLATVYIQTM